MRKEELAQGMIVLLDSPWKITIARMAELDPDAAFSLARELVWRESW